MASRFFPAVVLLGSLPMASGEAVIDRARARQYFDEARQALERDGGRLWGMALEGPMMFVDAASREVVANQADRENRLTAEGAVFVGHLPPSEAAANISIQWAGLSWTVVRWPLPQDPVERRILMIHESWHRIQRRLGLPPAGPANTHLDAREGRRLLQLEWRALARALRLPAGKRRPAVEDALVFRAARRAQYPGAATQERALEMHEGLAEYTGFRLCGLDEPALRERVAQALLDRPAKLPSFVRSFAYLSGPAYGVLLDQTGVVWRRGLTAERDLGELLRQALDISISPSAAEAERRGGAYDGQALAAAERERADAQARRETAYRRRFVDGAVLRIPLRQMKLTFDPNALWPLEQHGTVYGTLEVSDNWGTLRAPEGGLISKSFTTVTVPAPTDAGVLRGPGWSLSVKPGWSLAPGDRKGDFVLRQAPAGK
jgi:hypothetical protein